MSGMVARLYTWRGKRWRVILRWAGEGPRNVLIEDDAGQRVVRPFRGMRRVREGGVQLRPRAFIRPLDPREGEPPNSWSELGEVTSINLEVDE